MALILNDGLIGFTRKRIGLRDASRPMTPQPRIQGCSLHHGGPVGPPRLTFRAMRQTILDWDHFHRDTRGWSMIGYHFLIDGLGRIYCARPVNFVPAAVEGHNTGTIAINFAQDGRTWGLTRLQKRTLRMLFRYGCPKLGIPPLKTLVTRVHNEYSGHETNECPGQLIKGYVVARRRKERGR